MRVEEICQEAMAGATDDDLRDARARFIQIHKKHQDPAIEIVAGIPRPEFLAKYVQLRTEMRRRGRMIIDTEIDRELSSRIHKKAMLGIDVPGLGEQILAEGFVAIAGDYIRDPKDATELEVIILKAESTPRDPQVEGIVSGLLKAETGKPVRFGSRIAIELRRHAVPCRSKRA